MKENKASVTAFTVLQGLMYVAKRTPYAYLVPEDVAHYGEKVLQYSEEGRKRLAQLDKFGFSFGVKVREALFLPGITLHYIFRKRCIEERARQAIADGVKQIVCLGAGFDSFALRIAKEFENLNVIEIDHPATQEQKKGALEEAACSNLHYLSIDFTHQNMKERLGSFEAFDAELPTLYICEGVTMYLSEEEVITMFESIRHLSGAGTQLIFTALEPQNSPRNNTRKLLDIYLNLVNEPIRWSIECPKMEAFLKARNCSLLNIDDTNSFQKMFLNEKDTPVLHHGEYIVSTRFD